MEQFRYNDTLNKLEIDPVFIEKGLLEAKKRKLDKIKIVPLNHFQEYGFASSKELQKFKLDTSFFKEYNFIKSLQLDEYIGLTDESVKGLYELTSLEEFGFENTTVKPDLANFPLLETLWFKYNDGVKNISALKKLKDLLLISLKTKDCSHLKGLEHLEMLRLSGGTFTSIDGVENFKIKRLDIDHNSKVENIEAIKYLPALEILNIEKCKNIQDYGFLAGNKSIKNLFIDSLDSLSFVPAMEKLEKINFWDCKDGNMAYLLESKSLTSISFPQDKKHYTHKLGEIFSLRKK
ncbi:MAG: hypothetical protein FWG66_15600 [Spirochaetes bacterium]|nr:hypothetical protein [Spirochaetota bacterium]